MHPVSRVLAVAYVALAVFGALVYVAATANYADVAQVRGAIDGYVSVVRVDLNWSGNASDAAQVLVSINVTDPGRAAIVVLGTDFEFHMDNPADPRPWYDATKLDLTFVSAGGLSLSRDVGIVVPAGATRTVVSVVTVDPSRMGRFDRPDAGGRYHPVIWAPVLVYTFRDFNFQVPDLAYMAPYYDAVGVLPSGP